jgi:hypothetical protein
VVAHRASLTADASVVEGADVVGPQTVKIPHGVAIVTSPETKQT